MNKVREYREERCDEKGQIKSSNISKNNSKVIKELNTKMKKEELVVFTNEKSAKLTADSVTNYMEALDKHSGGDVIIGDYKVRDTEKSMYQHLSQLQDV